MDTMAIGFLMVFVDFPYHIGFLEIGLLPTFVGLILIWLGCGELERGFLAKYEKLALLGLIAVFASVYFCNMFSVMLQYSVCANFVALGATAYLMHKIARRLDMHITALAPKACAFNLAGKLNLASAAIIVIAFIRMGTDMQWLYKLGIYIDLQDSVATLILVACFMPAARTLWNMHDIVTEGKIS